MSTDAQQPAEPRPCGPCRGTGNVLSGLGGELHPEPCPWCEGSGVAIPGHDAQAKRRGESEASAES